MTSELLRAALAAADRGWHVFPLRPGQKAPAFHGYDRCPRTGVCTAGHVGWERRATADPDRIQAAWVDGGPYARSNIGIACGPSNLVVVDLDTAKPDDTPPEWVQAEPGVRDGQDVLAVLAEQLGEELPGDTYTVATPSGGLHLYFAAPDGVRPGNTAGERGQGLGWKIDTRAHGGQVVAAGSTVGGRRYRVLADVDPAPLPTWLVDLLTPAPPPPVPTVPVRTGTAGRDAYLNAAIHGNTAKVIDAKTERNAALYGASVALGQLVAGGAVTEAEVTAALMSAAAKHIVLGAYSERQARQTIASGLRNGANRPRQVAA
jgi:bifunctional DNA primase/polymerase-like protein